MDYLGIIVLIVIVLLAIALALWDTERPTIKGGSGACNLTNQNFDAKPDKIKPNAHIVVDGMNMMYHIKGHSIEYQEGPMDDVTYQAMIEETSRVLTKTFPRNIVHFIFKNHEFSDMESSDIRHISKRYPNIVYHLAYDTKHVSGKHFMRGRDDLLAIIVFNISRKYAAAHDQPAPYMITLDEFKNERDFLKITPFTERQFFRGKMIVERQITPSTISIEFLEDFRNGNLIKFEIIDKNQQKKYKVNGLIYPRRVRDDLCVNLFC